MPWRVIAVVILVFIGTVFGQNPPNAADKMAGAVVEQFGKAFKAGDADAVMKLVAVPFNLDGREILKDNDALEDFVKKACARLKRRPPIDKFKVAFVTTLAALEKKKEAPSRGVSFADVLDRDKDRMVMAFAITGERKDGILFGVRIEKGGAKIVGLFD